MIRVPYFRAALLSSLLGHVGAGYVLVQHVAPTRPTAVLQDIFEVRLASSGEVFRPEAAPIGVELSSARASLKLSKVPRLVGEVPAQLSQAGQSTGSNVSAGVTESGKTSNPGQAVKPVYPDQSRLNGEEGQVKFWVRIDPLGRPARIELVHSSGFARLDQAARKAVVASSFSPSRIGADPVESDIYLTYTFKLEPN